MRKRHLRRLKDTLGALKRVCKFVKTDFISKERPEKKGSKSERRSKGKHLSEAEAKGNGKRQGKRPRGGGEDALAPAWSFSRRYSQFRATQMAFTATKLAPQIICEIFLTPFQVVEPQVCIPLILSVINSVRDCETKMNFAHNSISGDRRAVDSNNTSSFESFSLCGELPMNGH